MYARMKTFTDLASDEINPFYLAAANFSQLKREKVVAICHKCLLCVTNMNKNTDALLLHCVFNPKCTFILNELSLQEIVFMCETNEIKKLLKQHFYMINEIVKQNSNICVF